MTFSRCFAGSITFHVIFTKSENFHVDLVYALILVTDGRVNGMSAARAVDSGLIPSGVKPISLK